MLDADSGGAALAVSQAHSGTIDLLVTDVPMPAMFGDGLARRLLAERPDLQFLYVSGFTENSVIHRGVPGPEVAFLAKPFSRQEITDAVARLLSEGP